MILHLSVYRDCAVLKVHVRPFQAESLIDTKPTEATQQISSLRVRSLKILVQGRRLFTGEYYDIRIIIDLQLGHMYLGILVQTHLVICVNAKIISGIRLTEYEIEHFKETFNILESVSVFVVELSKVIVDLRDAYFVNVTAAETVFQMYAP